MSLSDFLILDAGTPGTAAVAAGAGAAAAGARQPSSCDVALYHEKPEGQ